MLTFFRHISCIHEYTKWCCGAVVLWCCVALCRCRAALCGAAVLRGVVPLPCCTARCCVVHPSPQPSPPPLTDNS